MAALCHESVLPPTMARTRNTDMLPILEKYNLRGSFAIIGDLVGTTGYMTLAQLKDLVARGHGALCMARLAGWITAKLQQLHRRAARRELPSRLLN